MEGGLPGLCEVNQKQTAEQEVALETDEQPGSCREPGESVRREPV